ncbi:hypothetical protein K435DRAFT_783327 [Dendrothele bispora CBS 962.96]|uniref:Uncharacterized protein n=1 Tax=Dendrothele bispora (strain CBS 962.96) TaxID=1314807 RepID=A0A4S8L9J4_DENBC|nr:hypothetical protein K435DRAFT_783327 [Dendrothele bispora CBS 962.96]
MASFVDPPVKRELVIQTEELISAVEKEIHDLEFPPAPQYVSTDGPHYRYPVIFLPQ